MFLNFVFCIFHLLSAETGISVWSRRCLRRWRCSGEIVSESLFFNPVTGILMTKVILMTTIGILAGVVAECIAAIGMGNPLGIFQCVMVSQCITHWHHIPVTILREKSNCEQTYPLPKKSKVTKSGRLLLRPLVHTHWMHSNSESRNNLFVYLFID